MFIPVQKITNAKLTVIIEIVASIYLLFFSLILLTICSGVLFAISIAISIYFILNMLASRTADDEIQNKKLIKSFRSFKAVLFIPCLDKMSMIIEFVSCATMMMTYETK